MSDARARRFLEHLDAQRKTLRDEVEDDVAGLRGLSLEERGKILESVCRDAMAIIRARPDAEAALQQQDPRSPSHSRSGSPSSTSTGPDSLPCRRGLIPSKAELVLEAERCGPTSKIRFIQTTAIDAQEFDHVTPLSRRHPAASVEPLQLLQNAVFRRFHERVDVEVDSKSPPAREGFAVVVSALGR